MRGIKGRNQKTYCVWNNKTDELLALDEPATKCAALMGISMKSFYTYVVRPKQMWTVIPSEKIGTEEEKQ